MQKIIISIAIILIGFLTFSCKKENKKVKPITTYSLVEKTTVINWTAYKFTEKIPVKGKFNTISLTGNTNANTPIDAINNVEFNIPINSIDSNDKGRDTKLVTNFFGSMKNTTELTGKVNLKNDGNGTINLKMNGISKDFPINYVISGQVVEINATINLDNWQAKIAIDALNLACKDLHKGKDGISKTWSEVNLNIVTYLKVE